MTANPTHSLRDPLAAFMAGAFVAESRRPVPLVATVFAVTIDAGLAVVETMRRFHNAEDHSIEATITFPVPVHATLFSLQARIGERLLTAHAESRTGARQTYETAIERGQSAVLHEEVLRGVHMLSVGHVPPGADIEVVTQWATTLSLVGESATLRIPLTVGDIYGRSPLPDSDTLVHGGPAQGANLTVHCADGEVELIGGRLERGRAFVPLDAPIALRIAVWPPRALVGRAADGREVRLKVEWPPTRERSIEVAILVDHSHSMSDLCSASDRATKHDAVVDGLAAIAGHIREHDEVDLWEFDDTISHVGSTRKIPRASGASGAVHRTPQARLIALAGKLTKPMGGTEIGYALTAVTQDSTMRDLLLVTDGKSHALDVQALAAAGRRITVVLVGEDSLEAHVGHLAALTGGDIFVVAGMGLRDAMVAALATLRRPHEVQAAVEGELWQIKANRGGATLTAKWRPTPAPVEDAPSKDAVSGRAVAAFAATLALPCLDLGAATELAVAEGLVTHLTSLVLVDDEGTVREEIPGVRKVALPTPRSPSPAVQRGNAAGRSNAIDLTRGFDVLRSFTTPAMARPSSLVGPPVNAAEREALNRPPSGADHRIVREGAVRNRAAGEAGSHAPIVDPSLPVDLSAIAATIDWDRAPNDLLAGDLSGLDRQTARLIEKAAAIPDLVSYAKSLGISPVVLVVGLLAHAAKAASRSAARTANAILRAASPSGVERAKAMVSLS